MAHIIFPSFFGRAAVRFTCPGCGKPNRTRKFTVEYTVNPFNKNDDGSVKSSQQVLAEAQDAAERQSVQFLSEPLCRQCENTLPYREMNNLEGRRRAAQEKQ